LERTGTQNLFAADDMATASRVDYANAISDQINQWTQMIPYMGFGTGAANKSNPTAPSVFSVQPQMSIPDAGSNYQSWGTNTF